MEAEPIDELLRLTLLERTDALTLTRSQLASARRWAVALENRLAEVRRVLAEAADSPKDRRVRIRLAVRLCDAPLEAS